MATFSYEARDNTGNTVSGIIEAGEARGAAGALQEQGLFPTRIVPVGRAIPASENAPARTHVAPFLIAVPLPALAMMYSQFGTLMDAGVSIAQAMTTLSQQTTHPRLQAILRECAEAVNAGHSLSSVMERHPATFTPIQTELIRAGEAGGMLDLMARRIAAYLEKEIEIRRRLKRETLYPKIVLGFSGCVLLLLGFLKSGSAGLVGRLTFGAVVGGTAFAVWWLLRYLNQFPALGAAWDRMKMLVPGVGGVARRYATARFARALAALYSGGILLTRAVEAAARACGNRAIEERILTHAPALNAGEGIAAMLQQAGLLSPLAVQMARTGEQTGSLDTMMDKVADYLESEADAKSHQIAVGVGVAALLVAALVVLYIALTFYAGGVTDAMKQTQ